MFREPNKKFMFDRYNTAISDGETWNKTKCLRKTVSHISKPIFFTHVLKSRALLTLSANCVLNWYERNTTPNQKPYFFLSVSFTWCLCLHLRLFLWCKFNCVVYRSFRALHAFSIYVARCRLFVFLLLSVSLSLVRPKLVLHAVFVNLWFQ